jgi:phospholipase C
MTRQVYQDNDNFDDNPLAWFDQFQTASSTSALGSRGMSFLGLDKFYSDCAAGTLPQVSYIVGPMELSEHPPYLPRDGAWLQKQVVDAVMNSPAYNSTVLMISFDGTSYLSVNVFHTALLDMQRLVVLEIMLCLIIRQRALPENGCKIHTKTWEMCILDLASTFMRTVFPPNTHVFIGFRLPFYIISPWTRGGHVFVENADHISQLKFIGKNNTLISSYIEAPLT